jgi:hypothetical protein
LKSVVPGVPAERVAGALAMFDGILAAQLDEMDRTVRREHLHPFPNGNGRTARILVNSIALTYGLPVFMRVRSRPGAAHAWVAHQAMEGTWSAAIALFAQFCVAALESE